MNENALTIEATINAPVEKVWEYWTAPEHITQWAFAADDWEAPEAENDVREGGRFKTVMAAKDGSASFDFTGTYDAVKENELLEYTIDDGRKVSAQFEQNDDGTTHVVQMFEPESENDPEFQRQGWQGILDNFKQHVENS